MIIDDLVRWENESDVQGFKFEHTGILVWPLIRYTVFSKLMMNSMGLSVPHAVSEKLSVRDQLRYLYRTVKGNPFSVKQKFDFLFFGTTAGVSLKVGHEWLGRINDHFVMEYNDRSLILDQSQRLRYKHPRLPRHVKCHDYINLCAVFKARIWGRVSQADAKTIEGMLSLLRKSWGEKLTASDYIWVKDWLRKANLRLPYLHQLYLELFKKVKPKLLFVEDASYGGINAWIMKWAKDQGIVACECQHGCIDIPYIYGEKTLAGYKEYLPDHLLLYGSYWAGLTRTSSRKVIIGNPYFDTKKEELEKLPRTTKDKTVLIISQGIVTGILVDFALRLAKKFEHGEYKIIFRLHPGEIPFVDRYKKLDGVKNIRIDKDQDIYKLMHEADHIVGTSSLTLFEAVGLNKKVYILRNMDAELLIPPNMGSWFKDADELYELIKQDRHKAVDAKIFWADHWRENYRNFINSVLEKRGV